MWARMVMAFAITAAVFTPARAQQPQTFGDGVSLSETTPIARVLDRPVDYEGKIVRVEGVVTAVCLHMGCWMALAPAEAPGRRTLLIKVDDGVIVFPAAVKGRRAVAQGLIQRIGAADSEGREASAEHSRQTGAASAEAATLWQLKATGALVY